VYPLPQKAIYLLVHFYPHSYLFCQTNWQDNNRFVGVVRQIRANLMSWFAGSAKLVSTALEYNLHGYFCGAFHKMIVLTRCHSLKNKWFADAHILLFSKEVVSEVQRNQGLRR